MISLVIVSAILSPVSPAKNNANKVYALTPEYLSSTVWETDPDEIEGTMKITFTPDGRFKFMIDLGQSYISASGSYSIKGGKLSLMIEDSDSEDNIGLSLNNGVILTDNNSPKYTRYLYFKKITLKTFYLKFKELMLWDTSSAAKEGKSVSIQGIDAVTMGVKKAVVTAPLKMREKPDQKGKEINITCEHCCDDDVPKVLKSLPKGQELLVLARTRDKRTVGKWNNYWYYVEFRYDMDIYVCKTQRAWVYGEFVKFR